MEDMQLCTFVGCACHLKAHVFLNWGDRKVDGGHKLAWNGHVRIRRPTPQRRSPAPAGVRHRPPPAANQQPTQPQPTAHPAPPPALNALVVVATATLDAGVHAVEERPEH